MAIIILSIIVVGHIFKIYVGLTRPVECRVYMDGKEVVYIRIQ